jgi:hypothetical protein
VRRFDCFPFNHELDMLECRLRELSAHVDYFVLVEAPVSHQGNPKPLHYAENADRFAKWADQIIHVVCDELPSDPDPWTREHAQREWIRAGLLRADVQPDDLIFQSDVDEIPRTDVVDLAQPSGVVVCDMDLHCFAVDWLHPERWHGTTIAYYRDIDTFTGMRDTRLIAPMTQVIPNAGWHFTWLGDDESREEKLDTFAHPETKGYLNDKLVNYLRVGVHVDGKKLRPVDVGDWPQWVMDRECPETWWRPRDLGSRFQELCSIPSDINEHLPLFSQVAQGCDTIIELGTRGGVSTVAWLHGLPPHGRLFSVDIHPGPDLGFPDDRWEFIQGDDLEVADRLPVADVVFIDTTATMQDQHGRGWRRCGSVDLCSQLGVGPIM